jgi:RNA polymerase sigma-70 factor (ECF subfamily)
VRAYIDAWERRDVEAIVAILVEDATFAMPPHPHWFRGRDEVIAFITGTGCAELRYSPTRANGQPAVGWYIRDPESGSFVATALEVLTLDGSRLKEITAFVFPELFPRFGLAPTVE